MKKTEDDESYYLKLNFYFATVLQKQKQNIPHSTYLIPSIKVKS